MENIVITNFFIFVFVVFVRVSIGLDLKKWYSWLFVIYGFLSGFFIGFFFYDVRRGLMLGGIFGLAVMFSGAMVYSHRKKYEGLIDSWLEQYGQSDHPSLLIRITKKLFKK